MRNIVRYILFGCRRINVRIMINHLHEACFVFIIIIVILCIRFNYKFCELHDGERPWRNYSRYNLVE